MESSPRRFAAFADAAVPLMQPPGTEDAIAMKPAANVTRRYLDLLAEEGYRPKLEGATDLHTIISFKSEGEAFMIFVDEDDEAFLHVGSFYELGEVDIDSALCFANDLNERLKAVKVTIAPDDGAARFYVETYLDDAPAVKHIERAVDLLRGAALEFFEPARALDRLDA
jgi:hypothetical protein